MAKFIKIKDEYINLDRVEYFKPSFIYIRIKFKDSHDTHEICLENQKEVTNAINKLEKDLL